TQVGWATEFDNGGPDVSVYAIIESADPLTGKWTTQSRIIADELEVLDNAFEPRIFYDQTNGYVCGVAMVNTSIITSNFVIDALDENGVLLGSSPLILMPKHHTDFLLKDLVPASIGHAGTVTVQAPGGSVATIVLMGIKATNYTVGWTQTSLPVIQ